MDEELKKPFVGAKSGSEEYETTEDTLRSNDTVEVLLAISEGPIKGLKEGTSSFFLNDTQLVDDEGESNFGKFYFKEYTGLPGGEDIQSQLGGFASSITVEQPLYKDISITRTTQTRNINALEVRLTINRLFKNRQSGVFQQEVTFKIEYKRSSSSTWLTPYSDEILSIKGKTTSPYVKEYRWDVPSVDDTYDIRVTKLSPADDNPDHVGDITWSSIQEVNTSVYNFPGLACVQFSAKASKRFTSLPEFSGIYRGRLIKVPTNFNGETRTYTGLWDGTFKLEWTDDPAWILYDLITNETYGLSSYHPITMDKWEVYEASQWCSERVPDGKGGYHPRFSFNLLLSESMDAKELARYVAGSFNASFYQSFNNEVILRVDRPTDAVHLFTEDNVVGGIFNYSYTDITERFNDITVGFINPDLNWQEDRRRVYDQDSIDRIGRVPLDIVAVGCTNVQQALRVAKYKLVSSLTETAVVTFQTNRLAHNVFARDVILIGDPSLGYSLTGRILYVDEDNNKLIHLRDPIYLEVGVSYSLLFETPDGVIEVLADSNTPRGTVESILLQTSVPPGLPEFAVFSLQQPGAGYGLAKPFWVASVREVEGKPDLNEIVAIELNRDKWNIVDNMLPDITEPTYSYLTNKIVSAPTNAKFELVNREYDGRTALALHVSWDRSPSKYVQKYEIFYSRNDDPSQLFVETFDTEFEVLDVAPGEYDFYIYAVNLSGLRSEALFAEYTIGPEDRVVTPATNLRELFNGGTDFYTPDLAIKWDHTLDQLFYRYVIEIRNPYTGELKATWYTTDDFFVITKDMNFNSVNNRRVRIDLYVEDKNHNLSAPLTGIFYNAPPTQLQNFSVTPTFTGWNISFDPLESVRDLVSYRIWGASYSGFPTNDETLLYDGLNNSFFYPGKGVMYFKAAAVDTYGTDFVYTLELGATVSGTLPENSIDTPSIITEAVLGVQTNTVTGYLDSTNNQETSYEVTLASFVTAPVTDGKILLFFAVTTTSDYLARAYADSANFNSCIARVTLKRSTGEVIWESNIVKSSARMAEAKCPPSLILYDSVPPNTLITYKLSLYARHDDPAGRTTSVEIVPFKLIIIEGKR